jgi:hypothetical protein
VNVRARKRARVMVAKKGKAMMQDVKRAKKEKIMRGSECK